MRPVAVPVLLATIALAGCAGGEGGGGTGASGPDEDQIRAVAKTVFAAYDAKDWDAACDHLSPKARTQIAQAAALVGATPGDCPGTLRAAEDATPEPARLALKTIEISGDTAVAPGGALEAGEPNDLTFEKVDGRWYAGADPDE